MLEQHAPIALENAPPVSPFDDRECQYVAMPDNMRTYIQPPMRDWGRLPEGRAVLECLAESLKSRKPITIDMLSQDEETYGFIGQILGEGEIAILADRQNERLAIAEAVLTGVWRVRRYVDGKPVQDYLETGAYPEVLMQWASAKTSQPVLPDVFPGNLMNAPSLLYEIFSKSRDFAPGREEVLNLTLLPLTPEDMEYLVECMGLFGLSILARGYGDCRIRRTGLANIWWVQYFNSPGQLILNTLEITELPKVAMAAPEDLEDSSIRLDEILAQLPVNN